MSLMELKFLILAQIGIDIIIVIFFVFLIRKLRYADKVNPLIKGTKIFESVLTDADVVAGQFKEQLEEKHRLITKLSEQLDNKIISLNVLLNRASVLLSSQHREGVDTQNNLVSAGIQPIEILELAEKGHNLEEIASKVSIPKEEVRLVLDLKEKLSQIGLKEGAS